jgi:hypothetical protein
VARCHSVASLMYQHITWSGDCMQVVFPTHKGDPEGKNAKPKHVFANPMDPSVCPVLALAIYVFCTSTKIQGYR